MSRGVLGEIADMDYAGVSEAIKEFMRSQVRSAGRRGVVLGLSGGVDSAVTATLAADCLPGGALALVMPDPGVSPAEDTEDALELAEAAGLDHELIDIGPIVREFARALGPDRRGAGNLRARIRAGILYHHAGARDYLVAGSSDRSERLIGYFTKHGDGAADIMPIASLYKTQVRGLARHLGVARKIAEKRSSPNLWPGHDAEEELGATYEEIDAVLHCTVDRGLPAGEVPGVLGIGAEKVGRIYGMYLGSGHKRRAAPSAPAGA